MSKNRNDLWFIMRCTLDLAITDYQAGLIDQASQRASTIIEKYGDKDKLIVAETHLLQALIAQTRGRQEEVDLQRTKALQILEELNLTRSIDDIIDWLS